MTAKEERRLRYLPEAIASAEARLEKLYAEAKRHRIDDVCRYHGIVEITGAA